MPTPNISRLPATKFGLFSRSRLRNERSPVVGVWTINSGRRSSSRPPLSSSTAWLPHLASVVRISRGLQFLKPSSDDTRYSPRAVSRSGLAVIAVICSESTTNRISSRGPGRPVAASPQGEDGIRLWQFCRCRATRCALIVRWRAESFRRNITDGVGGFAMDGSALLFGAECQIR